MRVRFTVRSLALFVFVFALTAVAEPETPEFREPSGEKPQRDQASAQVAPKLRPSANHATLIAGYRGEPFSDPPESAALARAMDAVRKKTPPASELFALIMVTDRRSGERRVMTRGVPSSEYARWLADPDAGPSDLILSESEEVQADAQVEVVTRSVHARAETHEATGADADEERALRARNHANELPFRIDGRLRQRILRRELDLGSKTLVSVVIRLKGVPRLELPKVHDAVIDGLLYAGLQLQADRERAIIERKRMIADKQADLLARVKAIDGRVRYASWTGGSVSAEIPAGAITSLASHPDVLSIDAEDPAGLEGYDGEDWFPATDGEDFDVFHNGDGPTPIGKHPSTSRVLLGMSESCIDEDNPAFLDGQNEPARASFYACDVGACALGNLNLCSFSTTAEQHATKVAGVMMGDFMDGQDPQVSAPADRQMTGTCPECQLLFMQDTNSNDKEKVMEFACEQGVDIFQSSIAQGASCDGNGALDAEIEAMIDCDVIYVKGAGNNGSTSGACSSVYPADHPWTFAVAGVDTATPCTTAADYYTSDCDFADGSSMGGAEYNGVANKASIIDLAAPWDFGALIVPGTANPVQSVSGRGNSYANPFVAGLMAELLDWWATHVSDALFFDNRMRAFMLLMGDRSVDDAGTARAGNFHDERWGAGRAGLVPWDDKNIWSVHRGSSFLTAGGTYTRTLSVPAAATFMKIVVWHDGTDYADEPIIRVELDPLDCATATKSVSRRDSKAMLVYNSTPLSGCSQIELTIENVIDGVAGDRRFHYAAYSDIEDERNY